MHSITCGLYLKSGKLLEMYILCITNFLAAPSSSPTLTAIIIIMYHYHYHNYGLLLRIEWCLHGGS